MAKNETWHIMAHFMSYNCYNEIIIGGVIFHLEIFSLDISHNY